MIVIKYKTLEECMAEYFDCDIVDIPKQGLWEWMDGDRLRVWGMRRVIRSRTKAGTWGWVEDKGKIHIWIADYAKKKHIIRTLAHEMGHIMRPYKRISTEEEAKAERYAEVAQGAFMAMEAIV